MVETNNHRTYPSTVRPILPANYPEERRRVRRTNNRGFRTDVLHREALTRELTFLIGFELEFTLLKDRKGTEVLDNHDWSVSSSLYPGEPAEILDAMVSNLERAGIVVHSFHAEAGPGQYKIVTGPLQPLQAADALSFSRDVIRGTAAGYQRRATFAPWIYEHKCTERSFCFVFYITNVALSQMAMDFTRTYPSTLRSLQREKLLHLHPR